VPDVVLFSSRRVGGADAGGGEVGSELPASGPSKSSVLGSMVDIMFFDFWPLSKALLLLLLPMIMIVPMIVLGFHFEIVHETKILGRATRNFWRAIKRIFIGRRRARSEKLMSPWHHPCNPSSPSAGPSPHTAECSASSPPCPLFSKLQMTNPQVPCPYYPTPP